MFKNILAHTENKDKIFLALNYLIPILMGTYIFANPLPLSIISLICYYVSCAALIILLCFKKTNFTLRSPLTLPFALFFLWAVFGLFFALDLKNSVHDLRGHLLEYLIVFYLLVNYFNSEKKLETLSLIIIASVTVFSIGSIIQYYFIEGFSFSDRLALTFTYTHTNYVGFIIISVIPLALNQFNNAGQLTTKLIFLMCIIILCLTTLLTQSRASLIGLFVATLILCLNNKKFVFLVVAIIVLIAILPSMKNRIIEEGFTKDIRTKINRLTCEVIKDHPVTGIGFGMQTYGNESVLNLEKYNSRLPEEHRQKKIFKSPHNTLLDITVRTGIVGLILYLSGLLTAVFMMWKSYRLSKNDYLKSWVICLFACFMASMAASLTEDTTFGAPAVVHYTILAMITILWNTLTKLCPSIAKFKES